MTSLALKISGSAGRWAARAGGWGVWPFVCVVLSVSAIGLSLLYELSDVRATGSPMEPALKGGQAGDDLPHEGVDVQPEMGFQVLPEYQRFGAIGLLGADQDGGGSWRTDRPHGVGGQAVDVARRTLEALDPECPDTAAIGIGAAKVPGLPIGRHEPGHARGLADLGLRPAHLPGVIRGTMVFAPLNNAAHTDVRELVLDVALALAGWRGFIRGCDRLHDVGRIVPDIRPEALLAQEPMDLTPRHADLLRNGHTCHRATGLADGLCLGFGDGTGWLSQTCRPTGGTVLRVRVGTVAGGGVTREAATTHLFTLLPAAGVAPLARAPACP